MSVTTEKVRELLGTRLGELDDEKRRVERAIEVLGSTSGNGTTPAPTRRRRRRRGGSRIDQALELIAEKPGITASEVAKAMKIKPNYLYRVLGNLEKEGRVKKDGRTYYPGG